MPSEPRPTASAAEEELPHASPSTPTDRLLRSWVDPIRERLQSPGFEIRMESSDYDEGLTSSNALLIASRGGGGG